MPQALTWNIGTIGIIVPDASLRRVAPAMQTLIACSTCERFEYSTPLGSPVVPEV